MSEIKRNYPIRLDTEGVDEPGNTEASYIFAPSILEPYKTVSDYESDPYHASGEDPERFLNQFLGEGNLLRIETDMDMDFRDREGKIEVESRVREETEDAYLSAPVLEEKLGPINEELERNGYNPTFFVCTNTEPKPTKAALAAEIGSLNVEMHVENENVAWMEYDPQRDKIFLYSETEIDLLTGRESKKADREIDEIASVADNLDFDFSDLKALDPPHNI